jgi:hypothetical protein
MGAGHKAIEFRDERDRSSIVLSNEQLKTREVLERLKMAWIALWFVLILFSIALLTFLTALFFLKSEGAAKTELGGINGVLAWITKIVFSHLFPNPKRIWK